MDRRHAALLVAGLAVTMIAGDSGLDRAGDAREDATRVTAAAVPAMPAYSAGQILLRDPAGGRVRGGAADVSALRAAMGDALSTSDEGLVVEKSPVPGGGVMIDLQGRFHNAMAATVDAGGKVSAQCVGDAVAAPAPAGEGK